MGEGSSPFRPAKTMAKKTEYGLREHERFIKIAHAYQKKRFQALSEARKKRNHWKVVAKLNEELRNK